MQLVDECPLNENVRSIQDFEIWKMEIRDKKYVVLLQGSEMSAG